MTARLSAQVFFFITLPVEDFYNAIMKKAPQRLSAAVVFPSSLHCGSYQQKNHRIIER